MAIVIALCGLPGSGKGVFSAKALEMGIPVTSMGDIIRKEVEARGLTETPESVGRVALQLRKLFGENIVAERLLEGVFTLLKVEPVVIVDGIRSVSEYSYFTERIENLSLVAIVSDAETRRGRIVERGRGEDGDAFDFDLREQRELDWGMPTLLEMADYSIVNNGSLADANHAFGEWLESNAHS